MTLLYLFQQLGTAVFAISGVLTAVRKNFDLIGILVIATVTAIGGGTIRDLLLGITPVFWVRDVTSLMVIIASVGFSIIYLHFKSPPHQSILTADALGLALFAMTGAQIAEHHSVHWLIVIVMGTITGSAGGVIRDVLCAEAPLIFKKGDLYATTAILGVGLYLVLENIVSLPIYFVRRVTAGFWHVLN